MINIAQWTSWIEKYHNKEINFDNAVSNAKFENYDEYYSNISSYNFNKQIDSLCSNEKMVYDENGNWLESGDF